MLRDRNVALVVVARFISRMGGEAAFFVGVWGKAAYDLDASAGQIAVLMAGMSLATIAGTAMAGVLVDRFDPRRVLIWSELLFVPATLAMVAAGSMPMLSVFAAVLGLVGAPVFTAIASFAPYLTADERRLTEINSFIESVGMGAFVAGPVLGALVVRYASVNWIFVIDAATSLMAVVLVSPVRVRSVQKAERRTAWSEMGEGFRFSYRSRQLRFYLGLGSLLWFTFGSFSALEPLFYRDVLGVPVETLGWVNAVFGAGLMAGSLLLPRLPRRVTSAMGVTVLAALNAVGVLLYVGTDRLTVVVAGAVVWGLVIGLFFPLLRTLIQLNSPEEMVGRITGIMQVHMNGGELLPLAVVPSLAALWGVQPILIGAGVVLGAIGVAATGKARAIDRVRKTEVPPPEHFVVADEPISPTP
jgi:MFS transporter, DHA3 family, macrolide efflux protein